MILDFVSYKNQLEACRMTYGLVPHPAFQLLKSPLGLPMTTPWTVCAIGQPVKPEKPRPDFRSPEASPIFSSGQILSGGFVDVAPVAPFLPDAGETWRDLRFTETGPEEIRRAEEDARRMAERRVEIDDIWTEYGVWCEGQDGMLIHTHVACANLRNEDLEAIAVFYHDDGGLEPVESRWNEFRTADGALCVAERFSPHFRRTVCHDFQLFLPFDAFDVPDCGLWNFKFEVVIRSTEPYWQVLARSPWQRFGFRRRP